MIEMPGGPRVDHYYGRGIVGINDLEGQDGDETWEIILAGDVVIKNYDPDIPTPSQDLGGMVLVGAIFSELETKLRFRLGTEREEGVTLDPNKYSISDPQIVGGESFPQRPPEIDDEVIEIDEDSDIVLDAESAPKGAEDDEAEEAKDGGS
jgi:hypothetical protein